MRAIALSAGQEMLWFLSRLAPDSRAYNVVLAVRVRTPLDWEVLDHAVATLASRHEALRTVYDEVDGRPRGTVLPESPVRVRALDAVPERILDLVAAAGAEPLRLEAGEPFRVVLFRLAAADAVLVLVAHHIGCDATSIWLLMRDLLAGCAGVPPGRVYLPPSSYAEDERAVLASPRREELEAFWSSRCAGVSPAELPADRPRPEQPGYNGATVVVHVPAPARIREVARALKVTPFSLLLGTFQALLRRSTGLDEFVVGCPVSTRKSARLRETVGNLINTLVLRSVFAPSTTFADAALSAQEQVRTGLSHVDFPLSLLSPSVGIRPPRIAFTLLATDRLEPPLPMVAAGAAEGAEVTWHGLRLALVDAPHLEAQFDLNAEARWGRDSLSIAFRYDVELFDAGTIRTFADRYLTMLASAAGDPGARVDAAGLLGDTELAQLLALGTAPPRIEPV